MNGVLVRERDNIERVLRKFKRVCESSGVLTEMKRKRQFEKPCEEKRRKKKDAIRKHQMDLREEENPRRQSRKRSTNRPA